MKGMTVLGESLSRSFSDMREWIRMLNRRHPVAVQLFLILCFNMLIAPVVYAVTEAEITKKAAWAIGLLGIVAVGLSIYLFFVIFWPEKF